MLKALARTSAWFYGYPGDKLKIIGVTEYQEKLLLLT